MRIRCPTRSGTATTKRRAGTPAPQHPSPNCRRFPRAPRRALQHGQIPPPLRLARGEPGRLLDDILARRRNMFLESDKGRPGAPNQSRRCGAAGRAAHPPPAGLPPVDRHQPAPNLGPLPPRLAAPPVRRSNQLVRTFTSWAHCPGRQGVRHPDGGQGVTRHATGRCCRSGTRFRTTQCPGCVVQCPGGGHVGGEC